MSERHRWFEFKVEGATLTEGVDARALSRLIADIATGVRTLADERLGLGSRRGPLSPAERAVAAVRIVALRSSSVALEFAPPTVMGPHQPELLEQVEPDDVIRDFVRECESIRSGDMPRTGTRGRDAVRRVLRSAARIGDRALITHQSHEADEPETVVLILSPDALPILPLIPDRIEQRTILAHVYMADVEMGRQRLRVKLPDGSDLALDVHEDLVHDVAVTLDRLAELHVTEAFVGDTVLERVVGSFSLPEQTDLRKLSPPKSIGDLAREQGILLRPPPDYKGLASELFPTDADARSFREFVAHSRAASVG